MLALAGDTTADTVYGQGGAFDTWVIYKGGVISADNLYNPHDVAVDSSGGLYIADTESNRVLYYPAGSTTATRVYGQGGAFNTNIRNKGGISADSLWFPNSITLDSSGGLYVADTNNMRVLYYPAGSTTATRVYGQGGAFDSNTENKGGLSADSLRYPCGVAVDGSDNVYVADHINNRVLHYAAAPDTTSPTVTVEEASGQADLTGASPINFTATFSEPIKTSTFTADDVTLGGTAPGTLLATITETDPPNDGTTFNIAVSGMTGSGTVTASIGATKIQDLAGNDNDASTSTDNEVTYDNLNPTIASTDLEVSYTGTGPASFTAKFSKDVYDPTGNTDPDDVTNPANYLLVEAGTNGVFDTTACAAKVDGGLQPDDTQVAVNSVSYDNTTFTATVTIASTMPVGSYRLFVCGTTSIVDLVGNHLNGGSDYTFDFVVNAAPTALPATGFRHGEVTQLTQQPAAKAYTSTELTLEIPALGVSMPIVGVPQSDTSWDVTWLGNSAGWLNGSAYPTWNGNTVLTGHVWDAYNQPGPFAGLKTLQYGDQFTIQAYGMTYTYEVRENRLWWSTRSPGTVFQHEELDWVTLLTCETYNPFNGDYLFRRAVRAVLISVE